MSGAERTRVCVAGLGFVGMAFSVAIANALDDGGNPLYHVTGVDLPFGEGAGKIRAVNDGVFTLVTEDPQLEARFKQAMDQGNLEASGDPAAYAGARVVVVDIPLDVTDEDGRAHVDFTNFKAGIRTIGSHMAPDALVLVETTVPPGTCEKVVLPELRQCFRARGLDPDAVLLAHSYERVMPGPEYYDSMVNFWRVYAAHDQRSAKRAEDFLASVLNVDRYPLTRLANMTASETAKVLENSYRAANIAFMEEWGRLAEASGVDIFEVVDAIRMRPTHDNIRQPGFGVGGYCLTKDPLFAEAAALQLFGREDLEFPFCRMAVKANNHMPLTTLDGLSRLMGGSLEGKKILLCGVSYRPGVADTRHSPSQIFMERAKALGAEVTAHDPLVDWWPEMDMAPETELPAPCGFDAVVLAVGHGQYSDIDFPEWIGGREVAVFDANNVLDRRQMRDIERAGIKFASIGRG